MRTDREEKREFGFGAHRGAGRRVRGAVWMVLFVCAASALPASAQTRISDLVQIENTDRNELIGYGLVTGLDRTGDRTVSRRGATFTVQSIANMLENFGIRVDGEMLRTRNVAAVMVTASVSPYHGRGSEINVTVSSIGDASSLQGGVLLQTPLMDPQNEEILARAQGPLVVGGITAEIPGARASRNQTLTGTIPAGGVVQANLPYQLDGELPLGLNLRQPNYTNARRIVEAINTRFGEEIATVSHAGRVQVEWPGNAQDPENRTLFTSMLLEEEIDADSPARVVINERTGTIVAGGEVLVDEAMISHGSVHVRTQVRPFVSQPNPLGQGETVVLPVPEVAVSESAAQTLVLDPETTVQQLAGSLNQLGLTPRDIISIFQALDRAGSLRGQLIVM